MLRYINLPNWFFVLMMLALCTYFAYNFNIHRPEAMAAAQVPLSIIKSIVP